MSHSELRQRAREEHDRKVGGICRAHGGSVADLRQDKITADREATKAVRQHENQEHGGKHSHLKLRAGGAAEGDKARRRLDRPGRRRADGGASDDSSLAMSRAVNAGLAKELNPDTARAKGGKIAREAKEEGESYRHELAEHQKRARGGKAKGAGHVNVIVAAGQGRDRPVPVPVPAAGGMPPRPPMPPPAAGMGPPMGPPGGLARPPMMSPGGPGVPPMMSPGGPGVPPMMSPGGPGVPGGMPIRARGGALRADSAEAAEAHGKEVAFDIKAGAHSGLGRLARAKLKPASAVAAGD